MSTADATAAWFGFRSGMRLSGVASRRAMHPDQTPAGRQSYLGLALKAMRTFAQLVETLNHGRAKGPVQRVVVERVTVRDGGQAVVGSVGSRD